MRKIFFFLAVLILLTMLVLLPSQAESIPLPVVIYGTGNSAVIIYSSDGCLSSGEIISMWSDGSDGFYFLGRMGDNLNIGLFHWQLSCRQLTLVSFSDAGSMKAAYPQTYSGPIPLTDGLCAVMDETMIRIVPQSQPGTARKILSILACDQDASSIPLSVIDFLVNHPDVDVHYIDADLLDFDDSVLGENEKIDVIIASSNHLLDDCRSGHSSIVLNTSQIITKASNTYYSELRDAFISGNDILAVPMAIRTCHWGLDQKSWMALGLPAFPQTFRGIIGASALWETKYKTEYPNYLFVNNTDYVFNLIAAMLRQYVSVNTEAENVLDFSSPILRENIQFLYHTLTFAQPSWRNDRLFTGAHEPILSIYSYQSWFNNCESDIVPIFPPSLSGDPYPPIAAELQLAYIPAETDEQELAFCFLEELCMDESTAYLKNLASYAESNPFLVIHNQQRAMVASAIQSSQKRTAMASAQKNTDKAQEDRILHDLNKFLNINLQENYRTQSLVFRQMLPHLDFGLSSNKAELRLQLESFLYDDILQFEYGPMADWFDDLNKISQKSYNLS